MSIPKKQSRLIRIGDRRYRWRVRGRATYMQEVGDSNLTLAIQSADTADRSVLVAVLPDLHPSDLLRLSNLLPLPAISVTPELVVFMTTRWGGSAAKPRCHTILLRRLDFMRSVEGVGRV